MLSDTVLSSMCDDTPLLLDKEIHQAAVASAVLAFCRISCTSVEMYCNMRTIEIIATWRDLKRFSVAC
jgi:alpha-D-ribose 1-methylphosphonate 5-triphosphate synthase subunit PhnH